VHSLEISRRSSDHKTVEGLWFERPSGRVSVGVEGAVGGVFSMGEAARYFAVSLSRVGNYKLAPGGGGAARFARKFAWSGGVTPKPATFGKNASGGGQSDD